jgi:hypothetical protein
VDLIDAGPHVLVLYEALDGGTAWLRVMTAVKGKEPLAQTPVAIATRDGSGAVDLTRVDPARPADPGRLLARWEKPPAHAAFVDKLKAALR